MYFVGVLTINFGCQNTELRTKLLKDIQDVFNEIYSVKIPGLENEILFALPTSDEKAEKQSKLTKIQETVKDLQKLGEASKLWNADTDLCDIMKELNIL